MYTDTPRGASGGRIQMGTVLIFFTIVSPDRNRTIEQSVANRSGEIGRLNDDVDGYYFVDRTAEGETNRSPTHYFGRKLSPDETRKLWNQAHLADDKFGPDEALAGSVLLSGARLRLLELGDVVLSVLPSRVSFV